MIAARSAWLSATTSLRPSGDTARPSGQAAVTGGTEFIRPLPPWVGGNEIGACSVAWPVDVLTEKTCTTSPESPWVGPSVGDEPRASPETYACVPSGEKATPP